jgi:hypothetical protein
MVKVGMLYISECELYVPSTNIASIVLYKDRNSGYITFISPVIIYSSIGAGLTTIDKFYLNKNNANMELLYPIFHGDIVKI